MNETHIARVTPGDELCATLKVPHDETKFALMANLYVSEGQRGQVCIKFHFESIQINMPYMGTTTFNSIYYLI